MPDGLLQQVAEAGCFLDARAGASAQVQLELPTKTMQVALARGLAETTAGTGVTVNTVLPGPTKSEGVETFVEQMAARQGTDEAGIERMFFDEIRPSSLLKRFASTEEVANLVVYLASPLAAATNGAAMRVDGGVVQAIL